MCAPALMQPKHLASALLAGSHTNPALLLSLPEHSLSAMSLSALTEQLERLQQSFARPSTNPAGAKAMAEQAAAFHNAATATARRGGNAGSAAEQAALGRCSRQGGFVQPHWHSLCLLCRVWKRPAVCTSAAGL